MISFCFLLSLCMIPVLTVFGSVDNKISLDYTQLSYEKRREASNTITQKLFEIMTTKKTNIMLKFNNEEFIQMLAIIPIVGQYICAIKLYLDTQTEFSDEHSEELKKLATLYNFLIIGEKKSQEAYPIASWAHFNVVNNFPDKETIDSMKSEEQKAIAHHGYQPAFILAMPTSLKKGNELSHKIIIMNFVASIGFQNKTDRFAGVITPNKIRVRSNNEFNFGILHMIPEMVGLTPLDTQNQPCITPIEAFQKGEADLVFVRSDFDNQNFHNEIEALQTNCWNAYLGRLTL
jgi:hypothetical protein